MYFLQLTLVLILSGIAGAFAGDAIANFVSAGFQDVALVAPIFAAIAVTAAGFSWRSSAQR